MNCWNCGASVAGQTCRMCGVALQPDGWQNASAGQGWGDQQAWMPGNRISGLRQPTETPRYVPGGQPQSVPPYHVQKPEPPAIEEPAQKPDAWTVPQALLGGLVAAVFGAAVWACMVGIAWDNTSALELGCSVALALGLLVGGGVAFGAQGHYPIRLSLFSGMLGIISFFLAMYFRLSLDLSATLGEGMNFFAVPFVGYFNLLALQLFFSPIEIGYFLLVPLVSIGAAYFFIMRKRSSGFYR